MQFNSSMVIMLIHVNNKQKAVTTAATSAKKANFEVPILLKPLL